MNKTCMKTLGSLGLAFGLLSGSATADVFTEVVNLSGSESDGAFGSPLNTVVNVSVDAGVNDEFAGFAYALAFVANSPSWGSEARIDITSPFGTTFTFSGAGAGWGNEPGIFVAGGTTSVFAGESVNGTWTFRFYESFDDAISPDGLYTGAIFIITSIPGPGAMALLGLAGLATCSRRRRS